MSRPAKRAVVVVLGMPRSGTSLLMNAVHVMGVALGDRLLRNNPQNPEGFWEHEDIVQIQENLLLQFGRGLSSNTGMLPLPVQWWRLPDAQSCRQQLQEVVARDLEKTAGLWGFKDPRTSRLMPLWREIFENLQLEPIYVLALRHPLTVAASALRHWEMPSAVAQLMWLTHNLEALRETRGQLRLVVDYDRWFSHPRQQVAAITAALGEPTLAEDAAILSALQERIKPSLRNHQAEDGPCLPWVAETFALLQHAAIHGSLLDRLWTIDGTVRHAQALFQGWIDGVDPDLDAARHQRELYIHDLDRLCLERDRTIDDLTRLCAEREATIASLTRLCAEREATIANLAGLCSDRDAAIANLNQLCGERDATIGRLDRICTERADTITMLDGLCRGRDATIAELRTQLAEAAAVGSTS